jgi:hypothetical protein
VGLACLKGVGQWSGDCACLWIASLASFRDMVLVEILQACEGMWGAVGQSRDCAGLCRPEGCGQQSRDCASLRSGDHACVDPQLGRPWGCGTAELRSCRPVQAWEARPREWRLCMCGLLAWQA